MNDNETTQRRIRLAKALGYEARLLADKYWEVYHGYSCDVKLYQATEADAWANADLSLVDDIGALLQLAAKLPVSISIHSVPFMLSAERRVAVITIFGTKRLEHTEEELTADEVPDALVRCLQHALDAALTALEGAE